MGLPFVGFCLSIDGCPYLFSTADVTSMPSTTDRNDDATSNLPTDATLAPGVLDYVRPSWSERVQVIGGDLTVDSQRFLLHDAKWTGAGDANGYPIATWLVSRKQTGITRAQLNASTPSGGLYTLTVYPTGAGSQFSSGAQTIWCEQEAIHASGRTGDSFTVDAPHKLGSRQVAHTVDTGNGVRPYVFAKFPTVERRRVILWGVDSSNVALPIWMGYCRAWQYAKGDHTTDAAMVALDCEHAWNVAKRARLGIPSAWCDLWGFSTQGVRIQMFARPGTVGVNDQDTNIDSGNRGRNIDSYRDSVSSGSSAQPCADITELVSIMQAYLTHVFNGLTFQTGYAGPQLSLENSGIRYTCTASTNGQLVIKLYIGTQSDTGVSGSVGDPKTTSCFIQKLPEVLVAILYSTPGQSIPVSNVQGLPSSWTATTYTDGPIHTTAQPILLGSLDDKTWLVVYPTAISGETTYGTITGSAELAPKNPLSHMPQYLAGRDLILVDQPTRLYFSAYVQTGHWLYGLKNAMVTDTGGVVHSGVDPRNFDWTNVGSTVNLTMSGNPSRAYYLDGSRSLGDLWIQENKYAGTGLGIRSARVSPGKLRAPLPTDTIAATYTDKQWRVIAQYGRTGDGLVNQATLKGPQVNVTVREATSFGMYGQANTVDLELPGTADATAVSPSLEDLWNSVLSNVLSLSSDPLYAAKLSVPLSESLGPYIFDFVKFTDFVCPDGNGNRGVSNVVGQVVGRTVDYDGGRVVLEVLIYDYPHIAGFSPCVRIASMANTGPGGVGVITVATNYLADPAGGTTSVDYANSTSTGYPGTSGDGGTHWFGSAGLAVQFISEDQTTQYQHGGYTVQSVVESSTPGSSKITLNQAIDGTTLAYANTLNLILDKYGNGSAVTAYAKEFCWVGGTGGDIDTSTDADYAWAP